MCPKRRKEGKKEEGGIRGALSSSHTPADLQDGCFRRENGKYNVVRASPLAKDLALTELKETIDIFVPIGLSFVVGRH